MRFMGGNDKSGLGRADCELLRRRDKSHIYGCLCDIAQEVMTNFAKTGFCLINRDKFYVEMSLFYSGKVCRLEKQWVGTGQGMGWFAGSRYGVDLRRHMDSVGCGSSLRLMTAVRASGHWAGFQEQSRHPPIGIFGAKGVSWHWGWRDDCRCQSRCRADGVTRCLLRVVRVESLDA